MRPDNVTTESASRSFEKKSKRARDLMVMLQQHWAWTAPDRGIASAFCGGHVDRPDSSSAHAADKGRIATRQSHLLLAFGIVAAIVLPFLLRSRTTASNAAPATAMSSHSLPGWTP